MEEPTASPGLSHFEAGGSRKDPSDSSNPAERQEFDSFSLQLLALSCRSVKVIIGPSLIPWFHSIEIHRKKKKQKSNEHNSTALQITS